MNKSKSKNTNKTSNLFDMLLEDFELDLDSKFEFSLIDLEDFEIDLTILEDDLWESFEAPLF